MNFLVLDTIYGPILSEIERSLRSKNEYNFDSIRRDILNSRFGTSGCYEYYLSQKGHTCLEIVTNSVKLQRSWAREVGIRFLNTAAWNKSFYLSRTKSIHPFLQILRHFHFVAMEQVRFYKPNVLIIKDIHEYPPIVLKEFRKQVPYIIGFCSSKILDQQLFKEFNLILSSVPANLEIARKLGVRSKRVFPAFDTRNLEFESDIRDISTSFVGSIYPGTIPVLQAAYEVDSQLQIFAPDPEPLRSNSNLYKNYCGKVWGREMYTVYGRSKITINRHGAIASDFAGNMRLFEATGMGTCLLTENRSNLASLFDPTKEVIAYQDLFDLQLKLEGALNSIESRDSIARAGQKKCIEQHSYSVRVDQILAAVVDELINE